MNPSVCIVTVAADQPHDRVQALLHTRTLFVGYPEHVRIRRELARATAEHHPAAGEVVEQDHPVGKHQGVVVGQSLTPVPA